MATNDGTEKTKDLDNPKASDFSKGLSELKTLRSTTKGSITRIRQYVKDRSEYLSLSELECRLGILEAYFKQLLITQNNIEKLTPTEDNANTRGDLENSYVEAKVLIMGLIESHKAKSVDSSILSTSFSVPNNGCSSSLQKIKLPFFGGKYSEYPNFIGIFNKLVHNNANLDRIEKFNYLKGCLQDAALSTICDLEVTDVNYNKALEKLKERFDNKNLMFQEHITNMFELRKVSKPCANQIRALMDSMSAHLSAMLSLGSYENVTNAIIIRLATERLDHESVAKWDDSIDFNKLSSWADFSNIVVRRCQALEARKSSETSASTERRSSVNHEPKGRFRQKPKRNSQSTFAIAGPSTLCSFCKDSHLIDICPSFLKLSAQERFNQAKLLGLCIKCLTKGHTVRQCSRRNCEVCDRPHHPKLHRFVVSPGCIQQSSSDISVPEAVTPTSLVGRSTTEASGYVFLATAIVNIRNKTGTWQPIRALLDSASQLNIITQNAAHRLDLKQEVVYAEANGLGMSKSAYRYQTNAVIGSRLNNFSVPLQLAVFKCITGFQPNEKIDVDEWNLPNNIDLADPYFNLPSRIDMLVGADTFFKVLSVGQIKLGNEFPILQKTLLGWIVAGRFEKGPNQQQYSHVISSSIEKNVSDKGLHSLVERFWKIENLISKDVGLSEEEKRCEELFQSTTIRLPTGSFLVKLPFKEEVQRLGESFSCAYKRFLYLERKLERNPMLKEQYSAFLSEYEALGHMVVVDPSEIFRVKYYTPHQCVIRPDSSSTKLRVVFDCSCKTSTNLSLNDALMVGPTIQDDLFDIVLRFRFHKYALTADISKMYRQVHVTDNDSYYQCILWRNDPTNQLKTYRLKTVTYGTAPAPYLATRCLKQIAEDNKFKTPKAAQVVLRDFYVDDLITGAATKQEIKIIQEGVNKLLLSANFTLRKWYSNDLSTLEGIADEDVEKPLRINDSDVIKALGLVWHPRSDAFGFISPSISKVGKITKRSVLSDLSRLFDPLGLINPIVVRAKIFMQELWKSGLNWDESLPMEMHDSWINYLDDLTTLPHVKIPRYVFSQNAISYIELHGFSDASIRAFGACIYVRSVDIMDNICVNLITAKSRVAPLSTQSLPRLELCGALLLAELMERVKNNIGSIYEHLYNGDCTYLWTDSEVVLDWLSVDPSNWNTFVANRVSKIQELTKTSQWLHINSKSNPADIVSRGSKVSDLSESIWFKGPQFLWGPKDEWPRQQRHAVRSELEKRIKPTVLLSTTSEFLAYEKFSDFEKTCRVFAIIFRYFNRLKRGKNYQPGLQLSINEIHTAFVRIVWNIQQREFEEEISNLQNQQELKSKSAIKSLCPFLDSKNNVSVLRVGGRLRNAALPYESKHPLLLSKNSKFIKTYFTYLHTKFYHAGPTALVSISRQQVWVINARTLARKVVQTCIHCFHYKPKLNHQIMGSLPQTRVKFEKPFLISGVDFCGPIQTTHRIRGKQPYKSYIAVFVCFATKAIHLEVVSDLSAKSFIAAFRRFIGRRGFCQHLYCDNGTNFVGARNLMIEFRKRFLEEQTQRMIASWCSSQMVEFHHIPPRSPHFGGLWESAVKSAKRLLVGALNSTLLTFEELSTACVEVEAILNSRPLCSLSADPNDEEALTPSHFWTGQALVAMVEPYSTNFKKLSLLDRWQQISVIKQHFWQRWSKEYLLSLQQRVKWRSTSPNVAVGTLVLISEDNIPPQQWLLGRVTKAIPGPDGRVRVVELKTKRGILRRTIHRIAPLPIEDN